MVRAGFNTVDTLWPQDLGFGFGTCAVVEEDGYDFCLFINQLLYLSKGVKGREGEQLEYSAGVPKHPAPPEQNRSSGA